MSKKHNGVNFSRTPNHRSRRVLALDRLEAQLKSGTKTVKKSFNKLTPLSDSDIKRINGEINILKARV